MNKDITIIILTLICIFLIFLVMCLIPCRGVYIITMQDGGEKCSVEEHSFYTSHFVDIFGNSIDIAKIKSVRYISIAELRRSRWN